MVDGDTLDCEIALPLDTSITKRVRLKGWWAPELASEIGGRGFEAKRRLEAFIEGKAIYLFAPGQRFDKYGRLIADLWHAERIISAREVLGELQLTKEQHKQASDELRARKQATGAQSGPMQMTGDNAEFGGQ